MNQTRLKQLLRYDPDTGRFTWLVTKGRILAGNIAGHKNNHGYWLIRIDRQSYMACRLAWLYMTGNYPALVVDHINGIRDDNRFSNLRLASKSENGMNRRKVNTNNTSGVAGVNWSKDKGKWEARITRNYRKIRLGYFERKEDAVEARRKAERDIYGEFSNDQEAA